MHANRRELIVALIGSCAAPSAVAWGKPHGPVWIEVVQMLGSIGENLAAFSRSVGEIADDVIRGRDRLQRRAAKAALRRTSVRLASLIADQQQIQPVLDRYGALWRRAHRADRPASPEQLRALDAQWREAIVVIRRTAAATIAVLRELRAFDSDIVLDDAYVSLQEALAAKAGVLTTLARTPPPGDVDQLARLVEQEETFLRLRVEARNALQAVNLAIAAIRT